MQVHEIECEKTIDITKPMILSVYSQRKFKYMTKLQRQSLDEWTK